MIVHENVELLSSFVDDELEPPLRAVVESHLAACPPCRERLGGLRRVAAELGALEVVTPPAGLAGRVRHAVRLESGRSSGLRRSAESLRRWTGQPLLLPLFGVVTALAVLLYLFTVWSDRAQHPGTTVVVGAPPQEAAPAEGATARLAGRTFDRVDGRWIERGVDPGEIVETLRLPAPRADRGALERFRQLGGRVVLRDGPRAIEVDFGPG